MKNCTQTKSTALGQRAVALMALAAISLPSCGFALANIGSPATRLSSFGKTLGTFRELASKRRDKMFLAGQVLLPKAREHHEVTAAKSYISLERSRLRAIPKTLGSLASLDRVKRPAIAERAFALTSPSHPRRRLSSFFSTLKILWSREQRVPRKQR